MSSSPRILSLALLSTTASLYFFAAVDASPALACSAYIYSGLPSDGSNLVSCSPTTEQEKTLCYLLCGLCTTPEFLVGLDPAVFTSTCSSGNPSTPPNAPVIVSTVVDALMNVSAMHGVQWLDDEGDIEQNVTQIFYSLLASMPRRDMIVLFAQPFFFLDFLQETSRFAMNARSFSASLNVSWELFLEYVVPYSILDEKRDLSWRWRPRFAQLFGPIVAGSANITDAMHRLAAAIPDGQSLGSLGLVNDTTGVSTSVYGQPMSWRSEVSPAYLSPQQVAYFGGSCTGTGIVLVAAARSVGIPARLAGCSESVARGDDHHWAEFYDPQTVGPFGDNWHTKEGTSRGNSGGPWDSPSGPMLGCLQGVIPGSSIDTLWATSWSSLTYLPALWSNNSWSQAWSFVGGVNRCGAYCSAWGCGVNNSMKWTQDECGPN